MDINSKTNYNSLEDVEMAYYNDELDFESLVGIVGEDEAEGYRLLKQKLDKDPKSLPKKKEKQVYPDDFEPETSTRNS